jgi:predicted component of type VI protein secretion system
MTGGRNYDHSDDERINPGDYVSIRGRGAYKVLTENLVTGEIRVVLPDGTRVWVDRCRVALVGGAA